MHTANTYQLLIGEQEDGISTAVFPFNTVFEIGPFVHVPHSKAKSNDSFFRQDVGPHINVSQGSSEAFTTLEAAADIILVLS